MIPFKNKDKEEKQEPAGAKEIVLNPQEAKALLDYLSQKPWNEVQYFMNMLLSKIPVIPQKEVQNEKL